METPEVPAFGPPPFRFEPSVPEGLRAPAFSRFFRLLTTALVVFLLVWMARLWMAGRLVPEGTPTALALGWPLAAVAVILYSWLRILTSRTRLTRDGLHQSWIWNKDMELRELAYGKLIRVRGLEWLIAPRLYVRTLLGKFAVFYTADREMLAEFERLVRELRAFRGF